MTPEQIRQQIFGSADPHEEEIRRVRKAAEEGDAQALYDLGRRYHLVEQNHQDAVRCYRAAAEQGHPGAQFFLGWCYGTTGQGLELNLEEATKWYRTSAEQGDSYAQNALGVCYRDGLGVERNLQEAAKWFRAAVEQGPDEAKANLQALEQGPTSSSSAHPPPAPKPPAGKSNPKTASAQPASSASVVNLLGFVGLVIPFGNILAPLILWMATRGVSQYLDSAGKEAINFQISYTIYLIVSIILCKVWIGLLLFPVIGLMWMIFMVVAAAKTGNGGEYRYPLTIRFLK